MNDFRDYDDYLMHYGVKGMHWGIRRYQPYPDGKTGKFLGSIKNKLAEIGKRKEARTKAYVEKHKKRILSSPQLTNRYYEYLTESEIESAKKEARNRAELYKQSVNIYARPKEIASLITATAAAAVALATLNQSPFGKYVRSTLKPLFTKTSYAAVKALRHTHSSHTKNVMSDINKRSVQELLASKPYAPVYNLSRNQNNIAFRNLARKNNMDRIAALTQILEKTKGGAR